MPSPSSITSICSMTPTATTVEGTDILVINQFFEEVHRRYLEQSGIAGDGAAGGSGSNIDSKIILESDDENNN
jgi:hypothetical protein